MCGLPESYHQRLSTGQWVLRPSVRAKVGDNLPPVCWEEDKSANLYSSKPFVRQPPAKVHGRKVA